MSRSTLISICLLGLATSAVADDLVVDASGAPGTFATITDAMAVADLDDRILVQPGRYPFFQYNRGVPVIGLGAQPSDIVIDEIAFHVSLPQQGYRARLSNLTIGVPPGTGASDPPPLVLYGNENGPGTFVLDGVEIHGGVFLRGGQEGFYVLFSNCDVDSAPGQGFSGETMYFGGPDNFLDLRSTRILGQGSSRGPGGVGLRIEQGTEARINGAEIVGGRGATGAPGIATVGAADVVLRLDGQSIVRGGIGTAGAGGAGVDLTSGRIDVGEATVQGGAGSPAGSAYENVGPTAFPAGLSLEMTPRFAFAENGTVVHSGETMTFAFDAPADHLAVIGLAGAVQLPQVRFLSLASTSLLVFAGDRLQLRVPTVGTSHPGLQLYVQGGTLEPAAGTIMLTNTVSVRVDLD